MKHFIYSFVAAVIVTLFSSFVYAQDYQLFWLEKAFPTEKIIGFSKLSENKMIEALRTEYKVCVLIYDGHGPEEISTDNLKADQELLEYFKGFLVNNGNDLGEYFQPYDGLKPEDNTTRPSWDEPIILIQKSIPEEYSVRGSLIHEFMHHNIYLLRSEAPIEINGIKYS